MPKSEDLGIGLIGISITNEAEGKGKMPKKSGKEPKKTRKAKVDTGKNKESVQEETQLITVPNNGDDVTPQHGGQNKIQITPEMIARVEKYAGIGLTNDQIAAALDMHRNTLLAKCKESIELGCAIERGRAIGINNVAAKLYVKAVEQNNLMAQMFFLKTRAGWSEKTVHEISGPGGGAVEMENKWVIEIIPPPEKDVSEK